MNEAIRRKPSAGGIVSKLVIAAVLIGLVVVPIIMMFTVLTAQDVKDVFESPKLLPAVGNSLLFTAIATVIVIIMAYALAWCIQRTDIKFRGIKNDLPKRISKRNIIPLRRNRNRLYRSVWQRQAT